MSDASLRKRWDPPSERSFTMEIDRLYVIGPTSDAGNIFYGDA
jgi:hypothetical protein